MKFISLFFAWAGLGFLSTQVHAVVLELKDQVTIASPNLALNDLLQSSQGLTADDLNTVVAVAPSLGKTEAWTRARLEAVLPDSIKNQPYEWSGADSCQVNRPAVRYDESGVRQIITAELERQLPPQSRFAILEIPELKPFLIPDGIVDARAELAPGSLRNEWGQATLKFSVEGQLAVTQNIRFHWSYTCQVWQVISPVPNGEALNTSTFQQVEINVLKLPGSLLPTIDFPDGKIAARALPEGKILMGNDWIEPLLVARNDLVAIHYEHHGVSITVAARALSNGMRDQVIQVQNLSSRKIFNARVVDERTLVYDE